MDKISLLLEDYEKLKVIKTYLSKLNLDRRKGEIVDKKVAKAKDIFTHIGCTLSTLRELIKVSKLGEDDIESAKEINTKITKVYKEILEFLNLKESEPETESKLNMASNFDLKTALSLLPLMDDSEERTRQLIDAIELYESFINDAGKTELIRVVLKSRLSMNAKLRLEQTYTTISELVKDMKSHLLTTKSDTALQAKLARTRQGDRSVEEFGKELEQLFVDLTISQAKGDASAYAILKPLNEKNAIKIFSDGLHNHKLATIIAARNFSSLKDAIRTAVDEDTGSSQNPQMMFMSYRGRGSRGGNFRYINENRGRSKRNFTGNQNSYYRGNNYRGSNDSTRGYSYVHSQNNTGFSRGQFANTNSFRGSFRGRRENNNVRNHNYQRGDSQNEGHVYTTSTDADPSLDSTNQQEVNYFFREDEN